MNQNINIKIYENNNLLSANNTNGILEDNFLSFHTDNDDIRINLTNFSFRKENNETILKITKDKCTLTLKDLQNTLEIPLKYVEIKQEKQHIEIEYFLISQEYPIKIILEIGEQINEI